MKNIGLSLKCGNVYLKEDTNDVKDSDLGSSLSYNKESLRFF